MVRLYNKSYWRLPLGLGEIQYGHITGSVYVWFRGRCLRLGRVKRCWMVRSGR